MSKVTICRYRLLQSKLIILFLAERLTCFCCLLQRWTMRIVTAAASTVTPTEKFASKRRSVLENAVVSEVSLRIKPLAWNDLHLAWNDLRGMICKPHVCCSRFCKQLVCCSPFCKPLVCCAAFFSDQCWASVFRHKNALRVSNSKAIHIYPGHHDRINSSLPWSSRPHRVHRSCFKRSRGDVNSAFLSSFVTQKAQSTYSVRKLST